MSDKTMFMTIHEASDSPVDVPLTESELEQVKAMANCGADAIAVFWVKRLLLTVDTLQEQLRIIHPKIHPYTDTPYKRLD